MALFRSGQSGLLLPGTVRPTEPRDIVALDRLVRYWPFDLDTNTSPGILADYIGIANGTLAASVSLASGQIGHCCSLPGGSTSYVDTSVNAGFTRLSPFTISCWARATTSQTGNILIGTFVDSGSFDGIFLAWAAGGHGADKTVIGIIGSDSSTMNVFSNTTKILNAWYHIVATYDGSNAVAGFMIWENGEFAASTTAGTTCTADPADRPWRIGNDRAPADSGFIGFIDDVRVYNQALTATAIKNLYLAGLQGSRDQAPLGIEMQGSFEDMVISAAIAPQILMPAIQL